MEIFRSDCFNQEAFDTNTVLNLLKRHGVEITKFTLIRYANNGLIFEPKRKKDFSGYGRIYYCPLVPVEVITAHYLQKGVCAAPDIGLKISQLSKDDVFIARLLCYKKRLRNFLPKPFEISEYSINFMDYLNKNKEEDSKILLWSLRDGLAMFEKKFEQISLKSFNGKFDHHTYFEYLEMVYGLTFEHILGMCINDIITICHVDRGFSRRLW